MSERRRRLRARWVEVRTGADYRTFTALTLALTNVGCLVALLRMQFSTGHVWGVTGVTPWDSSLGLYLNVPRSQWNLPEVFFVVSLLAFVVVIPASWWFTKGARGRWRMIGMVAFFAVLPLWYSIATVRGEAKLVEYKKLELEYYRSRIVEENQDDYHWWKHREKTRWLAAYYADRKR